MQVVLPLNTNKCHLCSKEIRYLGHVVNSRGINTDPDKIAPITEFRRLIRSFLGVASWYRNFVEHCSNIMAPLTRILKRKYKVGMAS